MKEISLNEMSHLLYYSAGILPSDSGRFQDTRRTYPSAGARYPLEVYLCLKKSTQLDEGLYHYNVKEHALEILYPKGKLFKNIANLTGQPWVRKARAIIVITAVFGRTTVKYGDRGYRHILIEAGHLGQNLYLVAEALGLKICALGGFRDEKIDEIIDLDGSLESVIYMFAVGK